MLDGYYRLTHREHQTKVQYVFQNRCDDGFVSNLLGRGWSFEPVIVLTPAEFTRQIMETRREVIETTHLSEMTAEMTTLP